MHGMINRGLQSYVRDIFGQDVWEESCTRAELPFFNFETMLKYKDDQTERVIEALCEVLQRPRAEVLEDFGTYVVADDRRSPVRRLLQFGGDTYLEFLHSLEDVYDRAKIAMPDLEVPRLKLRSDGPMRCKLHYRFEKQGYGAVVLGLLRAMADVYGALVVITHQPRSEDAVDLDEFEIALLDLSWRKNTRPLRVVS